MPTAYTKNTTDSVNPTTETAFSPSLPTKNISTMANKEYRELLQAISSLGENERISVSNKDDIGLFDYNDLEPEDRQQRWMVLAYCIEQKKITDYYLIILKNTENEIDNIINSKIINCNEIVKHYMANYGAHQVRGCGYTDVAYSENDFKEIVNELNKNYSRDNLEGYEYEEYEANEHYINQCSIDEDNDECI